MSDVLPATDLMQPDVEVEAPAYTQQPVAGDDDYQNVNNVASMFEAAEAGTSDAVKTFTRKKSMAELEIASINEAKAANLTKVWTETDPNDLAERFKSATNTDPKLWKTMGSKKGSKIADMLKEHSDAIEASLVTHSSTPDDDAGTAPEIA